VASLTELLDLIIEFPGQNHRISNGFVYKEYKRSRFWTVRHLFDISELRMMQDFVGIIGQLVIVTSAEVDCKVFPGHILRDSSGWKIIDTRSGEVERLSDQKIHRLPLAMGLTQDNFTLEAFHDLILTNTSEVFEQIYFSQHVDEAMREQEWATEDDLVAAKKSEALSAVPHSVPGVVASYFYGYLALVHSVWINCCAMIVTFTTLIIFGSLCLPAGFMRLLTGVWEWIAGCVRNVRKGKNKKARVQKQDISIIRTDPFGHMLDVEGEGSINLELRPEPRVHFQTTPFPSPCVSIETGSGGTLERITERINKVSGWKNSEKTEGVGNRLRAIFD
jgi:hypothetical protein